MPFQYADIKLFIIKGNNLIKIINLIELMRYRHDR